MARGRIPRPAKQQSSIFLLCAFLPIRAPAAPLFEEKGDVLFFALPLDIHDPLRLHQPRLRAGFAANDDPVNAGQIKLAQIFEKRFY